MYDKDFIYYKIELHICKLNKKRWETLTNPYNQSPWFPGNEDAIHMTGNDNDRVSQQVNPTHLTSFSGHIFNKATIRIDNFFSIAGTSKAKRNNSLDRKKQWVVQH